MTNCNKPNQLDIGHVIAPLPIFSTVLEDHETINKQLKQLILEHRQNTEVDIGGTGTNESNVKAWHSSWTTHQENPKFMPFVNLVLEAIDFISRGYFDTGTRTSYFVHNMWAMMYEESEYAVRHAHFPSDFSCVYYVDVEPNCAPIVFEDPTDSSSPQLYPKDHQPFIIDPQNGLLVVWPGIIHHEVPATKGKRMAISMNFDKCPEGFSRKDSSFAGRE